MLGDGRCAVISGGQISVTAEIRAQMRRRRKSRDTCRRACALPASVERVTSVTQFLKSEILPKRSAATLAGGHAINVRQSTVGRRNLYAALPSGPRRVPVNVRSRRSGNSDRERGAGYSRKL